MAATGRFTRNRLVTHMTFRSAADVHKFAKDQLHRLYWREYYQEDNFEMEIFHEMVTVRPMPHSPATRFAALIHFAFADVFRTFHFIQKI